MSSVTAEMTGIGQFQARVQAGAHELLIDEPAELGGLGSGPNPYDLLCAALAGCTLMTLKLYAKRKGWTLDPISVRVAHHKGTADKRDRFDRTLQLGKVTAEQRDALIKIAQRCPVDLLLERGADVTVTVADDGLAPAKPDWLHAQAVEELCSEPD